MWLSENIKPAAPTAGADLGVTSIAGGSAGVITGGEVRSLPAYGPGGYVWQPRSGETVLVIRGGPGGEETCLAGARQASGPSGMAPGEVYLYSSGGAAVYLKNDGSVVLSAARVMVNSAFITLNGNVSVTGELKINGISCNAGTGGGTT